MMELEEFTETWKGLEAQAETPLGAATIVLKKDICGWTAVAELGLTECVVGPSSRSKERALSNLEDALSAEKRARDRAAAIKADPVPEPVALVQSIGECRKCGAALWTTNVHGVTACESGHFYDAAGDYFPREAAITMAAMTPEEQAEFVRRSEGSGGLLLGC